MKITDTIKYVGVNDHQVDLFEGQYKVPNGMSYNSYVILDEKVAVMDTVDANFTHEWLDNIQQVLGDRKPDYLIVQHMEPDHAANVANFLKVYPDTTVVSNKKAFNMIAKKVTKKNAVPAVSTYKLRSSEIYYGNIRIMPSYIMTGGNILIEKSKVEMASADIAEMARLVRQ